MFNRTTTNVRCGDATNNIDINSVSGTLVKNYRKSFFFKCKENSQEASILFDPTNPRIAVPWNTPNHKEETYRDKGNTFTRYYKNVVVLQTMILANEMLLNEVIWQDDFDAMFETTETN